METSSEQRTNAERISHRKVAMTIRKSEEPSPASFRRLISTSSAKARCKKIPRLPRPVPRTFATEFPALSLPRKRELPSKKPHTARTPSFGFVTGK